MRVLGESLARIDLGGSIEEIDFGKSEEIPASLGRHVGGVSTGLDSVAHWRGSNTLLGLVWRYTNLHPRGILHQILGGGDHIYHFHFLALEELFLWILLDLGIVILLFDYLME